MKIQHLYVDPQPDGSIDLILWFDPTNILRIKNAPLWDRQSGPLPEYPFDIAEFDLVNAVRHPLRAPDCKIFSVTFPPKDREEFDEWIQDLVESHPERIK